MTEAPFKNVEVRTVRRWRVYECPEHGIVDKIHIARDLQCPVAVKGTSCPHQLEGPIIVEEVHGAR